MLAHSSLFQLNARLKTAGVRLGRCVPAQHARYRFQTGFKHGRAPQAPPHSARTAARTRDTRERTVPMGTCS
ncbi:MAG TPA: hypothetical protein VM571_14425, partial [Noviherbaspirillum sp.]|nr:hypothetical protein [Noviherbaspirillum sp.]